MAASVSSTAVAPVLFPHPAVDASIATNADAASLRAVTFILRGGRCNLQTDRQQRVVLGAPSSGAPADDRKPGSEFRKSAGGRLSSAPYGQAGVTSTACALIASEA